MEFELSFFNIDYNNIKKLIKKNNGKKVHSMALYKVAYFYLSGEKNFSKGFLRIRDENGIITLTTKILDSKYPKEYETIVNTNYDVMSQILEHAGLIKQLETIKFREKWSMPGTHEVVFDIWPGLPIVMEIDCTSEKLLFDACKKLDINPKDGFTEHKYAKLYGLDKKITQNYKNLNYKNAHSFLKKHVITNKDIFNSLDIDYYKKFIPKKYYKLL